MLYAAPGEAGARRKLDMADSIRGVGVKALDEAQATLEQSLLQRAARA